ncbi:Nitrogen permease regulator-like 2 [Sparganum proliferum]
MNHGQEALLEGPVKAVELVGILYSTFENVRGPVICYQYPKDYVSTDQFKQIAHAVIPRADLTHQPITIEEFGHFIVGFPQRIEGTQYKRNTLLFNVCLVIKPQSGACCYEDLTGRHFCLDDGVAGLRPAVQVAYELTARKINRYLAYLEEEFSTLSQKTSQTLVPDAFSGLAKESAEAPMQLFLWRIWSDLREHGLCVATLIDSLPPLYLIFYPRSVNTSITSYFVPGPDEFDQTTFENEEAVATEIATTSADFRFRAFDANPWSRSPSLLTSPYEVTDASVFVRIEPRLPAPRAADHGCKSRSWQMTYALAPLSTEDSLMSFWVACDLTSSRLLPLVDGQRSVAELSRIALVDVNIARVCLTQLANVGAVHEVSVPVFMHRVSDFQLEQSFEAEEAAPDILFSVPGYVGMPRLMELTRNETLKMACLESVLIPRPSGEISPDSPEDFSTQFISAILRVYCKLCASPYFNLPHLLAATKHYVDLVIPPPSPRYDHPNLRHSYQTAIHDSLVSNCSYLGSNPALQTIPRVDLLRLVQFGEVNGLIRRLYCYPISDLSSATPTSPDHLSSEIRTDSTPKNRPDRGKTTIVRTLSNTLLPPPPPPAPPSSLSRQTSVNLDPVLYSLQTRLWPFARSHLMDGVLPVDSIVLLLSGKALRRIQKVMRQQMQDWTPSQFSTLPDAIVTFTARLLVESVKCQQMTPMLASGDMSGSPRCQRKAAHLASAIQQQQQQPPTACFSDSNLPPELRDNLLRQRRRVSLLSDILKLIPRPSGEISPDSPEDCSTQFISAILRVYCKLCASPYFNLPHLLAATKHNVDLVIPPPSPRYDHPNLRHSYQTAIHDSLVSNCSYLGSNPALHTIPRVDLLRLVQFGEVNGLIRRLYCYPISDLSSATPTSPDHLSSEIRTDSTPKNRPDRGKTTIVRTLSNTLLPPPPPPAPPSSLSRQTSVNLDPVLSSLQTRLWPFARSHLMDGVLPVDSIVLLLSGKALRRIQKVMRQQMQDWTPSQFSTLPDAIVTFTARLLVESVKCQQMTPMLTSGDMSGSPRCQRKGAHLASAIQQQQQPLTACFSDSNLPPELRDNLLRQRRRVSLLSDILKVTRGQHQEVAVAGGGRLNGIHPTQEDILEVINSLVPQLYLLWH